MKFIVLVLLALTTTPAFAEEHAQTDRPKGVFDTYAELRVELDSLVMSRRISDLMIEFGAGDEMTQEELSDLQTRVQQIYPQDFAAVDLLRRHDLENGWRQELLVYSHQLFYLYAYVLLHQRDDDIVAVTFKFNSQFSDLNALF